MDVFGTWQDVWNVPTKRYRRPRSGTNLRSMQPDHNRETGASAAFTELVMLMANNPNMPEDLIRQHADDGTGRCRLCTAGAQTGRYVWPCQIYRAAKQAARLMNRQSEAREAARAGERARTTTELSGFAESAEHAQQDMTPAMKGCADVVSIQGTRC